MAARIVMFRWRFLVPRLLIVLGLSLWLRFGLDPLLSRFLVLSGQMVVGAKVDVERLTTSLPHGRLHLRGVQITDPRSPTQNLVQFDGAWIKMDTRALLDGHWVVERAAINGLVFDADRSVSGALPDAPKTEDDRGDDAGTSHQVVTEIGRIAEGWFDEFSGRLLTDLEDEFHSVRLTKDLAERWPNEYRQMADRVQQWKTRIEHVRQLVDSVRDAPLQHLAQIESEAVEVERLLNEIHQLRADLQRIHSQVNLDRVAIREASRHDAQRIRETLRIRELDGEELSNYLLGSDLVAKVAEWTTWVQRAQEIYGLLGQQPEINHEGGRGVVIEFRSGPQPPDGLIRSLAVSGSTQVEGSLLDFQGHFRDLTHQPSRHGQPVTYELVTRGATEAHIQGTIDYRTSPPRNQMIVACPAFPQRAQTWGDVERLALSCSGGPAQMWMHLTLVGKDVRGEIRWRQDDISITPIVSKNFGGARLQRGIAKSTESVNRIHATVQLAGTLARPRFKLQSNLGPQVARGINDAVKSELQTLGGDLSAQAETLIAKHLDDVDAKLQERYAQVFQQLDDQETQINTYKQLLASHLRKPLEQLGRRLDASEIRKVLARLRTPDNNQGRMNR